MVARFIRVTLLDGKGYAMLPWVTADIGDDIEAPSEREMQDVMHAAKMALWKVVSKRLREEKKAKRKP